MAMYWLTGTIGSSMQMYRANAAVPAGQSVESELPTRTGPRFETQGGRRPGAAEWMANR